MASTRTTTDIITADDIFFVASLVKGFDNPPSFILGTRIKPLYEHPYFVWALQYPDGSRYAVRVPAGMQSKTRGRVIEQIESDIELLERLARLKFPWSPRPITYSLHFQNHLRFPYMIVTLFDGYPLNWNSTFPAERATRDKILRQLAEINFELVKCTEEKDTDVTPEKFMTKEIDRKLLHVAEGKMPGISIPDCLSLRVLARVVANMPNEINHHEDTPNSASAVTSLAISHNLLITQNIIIDHDYNIKGLLNWSHAKALPLRFAMSLPLFLGPLLYPSAPNATSDDIHILSDSFLSPSPVVKTDRNTFTSHLMSLIMNEAPGSAIGMAAPMCCDALDIDWKDLIFRAVHHDRVHQWLSQRQFLLPATVTWWGSEMALRDWDEVCKDEAISFCADNLVEHGVVVPRKTDPSCPKSERRIRLDAERSLEYIERGRRSCSLMRMVDLIKHHFNPPRNMS